MEKIAIGGSGLKSTRIGLGTWAIGGWIWGGSNEAESIATIRSAIERGVTLIDTAPAYGFGRSEEIVGKALAEGGQDTDRNQGRPGVEGRRAISRFPPRPHPQRDRGFAAPAAHGLH